MADTPSAPPLPDGSVDFNAIHAAARQGHDLEKAIADARADPKQPETVKKARAPRTNKRVKAASKLKPAPSSPPPPKDEAPPIDNQNSAEAVDNKEA